MTRFLSFVPAVLALGLAFWISQSGTREDFFVVGTPTQQSALRSLFDLLGQENAPGAARFTLLHEITQKLKDQGELSRINLLLTTYTAKNPQDPFAAYYLFEVAENYRLSGALPMAKDYYLRILHSYPDLVVDGESVHYRCLSQLIPLESDPARKRGLLAELADRFKYKMTSPELYYAWARSAEALGRWDEAQNAYSMFLRFPDPSVPGDPKAANRVHSLVDLAQTDRSWIRQDLDSLVGQLEKAILNNDTRTMESLRAQVGFFAVSWDNNDIVDTASEAFDVRQFLRELVRQANYGSSSVRFSTSWDELSNENEVYIRSTGWNYRIPTWYFYFRRVEYPADPEINGGWEWAGVYFGEKI